MLRLTGASPAEQSTDWSLYSVGENFAAGYVQGFTTFDLLNTDSPDTMPEYIARSLGSVLGFVGLGPASLGKIGLQAVGKTARLLGAVSLGESFISKASRITPLIRTSVPAFFGKKIADVTTNALFESTAVKAMFEFTGALVGKKLASATVKDFSRSMFHNAAFMGFASAAGARPLNPLAFITAEDFEARKEAFFEGIPYGVAQSAIANLINAKTMKMLGVSSFQGLVDSNPQKADYILKSLRAVTAGLSMGGYTSLYHDAPIEYGLYEGILNGVFGWREMPYGMREAHRIFEKHNKSAYDPREIIYNMKFQGNATKWAISKGENPSPATSNELEIIKEHYWGSSPFNNDVLVDAAMRTVAKRNNMSYDDFSKLSTEEKIALSYNHNTKLGLQFLAKDYKSYLMEKREKELITEETKIKGELSEERINELKQQAHDESSEEFYEGWEGVAEQMQKKAAEFKRETILNQVTDEQLTSLDQMFRETGVPHTVVGIVKEVSQDFLNNKDMEPLKAVMTIGRVFKAQKDIPNGTFTAVQKVIEQQLKMPLPEASIEKLRTLWYTYSNSKEIDNLVYDVDGNELSTMEKYYKNGGSCSEYRARNFREDFFGYDMSELKTISGNIGYRDAYQEKKLFDTWIKWDGGIKTKHSVNMSQVIHKAFQQGKLFAGGKKQDGISYFEPMDGISQDYETKEYIYHNEKQNKTVRLSLTEAINELQSADADNGRLADPLVSYQELYRKARDKYVDDNYKPVTGTSETLKEGQKPKQVIELENEYDLLTANLMMKWKMLNGDRPLYELFTSKKFSINDVFAANKRSQGWFDSNPKMTEDIAGTKSFKGMVVTPDVEGEFFKDVFGKIMDTNIDGVTYVFRDTNLDQATRIMSGLPKESALRKTSSIGSMESGLIYQKHALHLATEKMQQYWESLGKPDFITFTSATKQTGDIPVSRMKLSKDGSHFEFDGKHLGDEDIKSIQFDLPVDAVRVNMSAKEDVKMRRIHLMKQIMENSGEDDALFQFMKNKYVVPSIEGNKEDNDNFDSLYIPENKDIPVDLDKVAAQKIIDVFHGKSFAEGGEKFRRVIEFLFDYQLNHGDEIEEIDGEWTNIESMQRQKSYVDKMILSVGREGLTPQFIRQARISDYFEQILFKYLKDRVWRPVIEDSVHAIGFNAMSEPDMRAWKETHNGEEFKPGQLLLGEGYKNFKVKQFGDKTLEELWNEYQKGNIIQQEFINYKGGFENRGKGTSEGDGKDKAMRQTADGGIFEIAHNKPSSTITSAKTIGIIDQKGRTVLSAKNLVTPSKVVMLARNSELSGKPLEEATKNAIQDRFDKGAKFIVGDMPNVDSQFIDYLKGLGAEFTIYHTGNKPRIKVESKVQINKENKLLKDFFDNFVSARSPQSDLSGNRRQTFMGFIEGGGWGAFIHPMDMRYSDGADMDIDSYAIYMGMPKKFTSYIDKPSVKHRFSRWFASESDYKDYRNGIADRGLNVAQVEANEQYRPLLQGNRDKNGKIWQEYFITSKGKNPLLKGHMPDPEIISTSMAMFLPDKLSLANKMATTGRDTLGPGLTAVLRAKQLHTYLKSGNNRIVDIDGIKYTLMPKESMQDFYDTKSEIVNDAADSGEGRPIADVDQVRLASVLSVADVYKDGKKLETTQDKQLFIDAVLGSKGGLKNLPLFNTLTNIDQALKPRDGNGKLKTLVDNMKELKVLMEDYSAETNDLELNSIWYETAKMIANLNYEPTATDYMDMNTRILAHEMGTSFLKDRMDPVRNYLYRTFDRTNLTLNLAKITDTKEFQMVAAYLAPKKNGKQMLDDLVKGWIHPPEGHDFRSSELFKLFEKLPDGTGNYQNVSMDAIKSMAELSDMTLKDVVKLDPDMRSVYFLDKNDNEIRKVMHVDEVTAWRNAAINRGNPLRGYRVEMDVERSRGKQIKAATELHSNDTMRFADIKRMIDVLAYHMKKVLGDKYTDADAIKFIDDKLAPFMEKVGDFQKRLRDKQHGIYDSKGLYQRKKAFQSFADLEAEILEYRNSLSPDDRYLFDSAFVSSLNFSGDVPIKEFEQQSYKMTEDLQDGEVRKAKRAHIERQLLHKWESDTFDSRTTVTVDIADMNVIREKWKYFNMISNELAKPFEEAVREDLGRELNLSSRTGYLPKSISGDPDIQQINNRPVIEEKVNYLTAGLKKRFLETGGNDGSGNIKDPKLKQEYIDIRDRLVEAWIKNPEQLDYLQQWFPQIMQEQTQGIYSVSPDTATKQDILLYLKTLEGQIPNAKEKLVLNNKFWFLKFRQVVPILEKWQKEKKLVLRYIGNVLTDVGAIKTDIGKQVGYFRIFQYLADSLNSSKDTMRAGQVGQFWFRIESVIADMNKRYPEIGSKLYEAMVSSKIEGNLRLGKTKSAKEYEKFYKKAESILKEHGKEEFYLNDETGKNVKRTGEQLVDYFYRHYTAFLELMRKNTYEMPDDNLIIYKQTPQGYTLALGNQAHQEIDMDLTLKNIVAELIHKGKLPEMSVLALNKMIQQYKLDELSFDIYSTKEDGIFVDGGSARNKQWVQNRIKEVEFTKKTKKYSAASDVEKSIILDTVFPRGIIEGINTAEDLLPLGNRWFHHFTESRAVREKYMRERFSELTKMPLEEVEKMKVTAIKVALRTLAETRNPQEGAEIHALIYDSDPTQTLHYNPGVLKARDENFMMPEWNHGTEASKLAQEQLLRYRYETLYSLGTKYFSDLMLKNSAFGEKTAEVKAYADRFTKQVLGHLDTIPSEFGEGDQFAKKSKFYKYHSDGYWSGLTQRIADTWFGGKVMGDMKDLEEMAGKIKFPTEGERIKWLNQAKRIRSEEKISWLSQMEAKWSLVSLLTSTRSYVTNVTSGAIMTYVNAGRDAFLAATTLKGIQDAIGSDVVKSRADVENIYSKLGIEESYLVNEFDVRGDSSIKQFDKNFANVFNKMAESRKAGKDITDIELKKSLQDNGLWDMLVKKGSWFMKSSERLIRRHSTMAHYINARKIFQRAGFELDWDDPWLMQIAKEGVRTSQYLYANSERPAFMASAMGKIFHRFKIFTYNTIEFKNNVIQQAKKVGYYPGSQDYERFERMMMTDLFVFGLASLMPYSLFGSALLPPYNYLQSALDYCFGTSKEKKRSFFGGFEYPLSPMNAMIPPSLREIPQLFSLAYSDSTRDIGDIVVGMLPFQRVSKDIGKSIKNPAMTVDVMTGFPFAQWNQYSKISNQERGIRQYLDSYRSNLETNVKIEKDINSYLEQYPSP